MNEVYAGFRWIRGVLLADATMVGWIADRVFPMPPPLNTTYPFVVATFVTGTDLMVIGATRVWSDALWQVEVWSRTSDMGVIAQRTERLDDLLHNASGAVSGASYATGTIWAMTRQRPLFLPPEVDGDVVYMRGGGEYRQLVTAA